MTMRVLLVSYVRSLSVSCNRNSSEGAVDSMGVVHFLGTSGGVLHQDPWLDIFSRGCELTSFIYESQYRCGSGRKNEGIGGVVSDEHTHSV